MVDPRIDLYCEDRGHEQFARALISRLAGPLSLHPKVENPSGRGGHGRALSQLRAWQKAKAKERALGQPSPELVILLIDANCEGWSQVHRKLSELIDPELFPLVTVGCPDPHIERWCFADPAAVSKVFGVAAPADPGKCERLLYKRLLRSTIKSAGRRPLTGEMEYAPDLVAEMDLYRAGKSQPSLGHFIADLTAAFKQLA